MRVEDIAELSAQPRFQKHLDLEDAIIRHAPDAVECQELLQCLQRALENRYEISGRESCANLVEAFDELNDRLEDLQGLLYEPEPFDNQDGL